MRKFITFFSLGILIVAGATLLFSAIAYAAIEIVFRSAGL